MGTKTTGKLIGVNAYLATAKLETNLANLVKVKYAREAKTEEEWAELINSVATKTIRG